MFNTAHYLNIILGLLILASSFKCLAVFVLLFVMCIFL